MHYFITSEENPSASAIEIAQRQRVDLFHSIGKQARIVELNYNMWHDEGYANLNSSKYMVNIFQYYQKLPYVTGDDDKLIDRILTKSGYDIDGLVGYQDGKKRLHIVMRKTRLYSVNYYDQYGFLNRADYYDCGCLSYTEFFEDRARRVMQQYYDANGMPIIIEYFRGAENNQPVLTMIQQKEGTDWLTFNDLPSFRGHFLDNLVKNDDSAVFYIDRSDFGFDAVENMKFHAPCYMIFHSALTIDGSSDGKLFDIYNKIEPMLKRGKLTGLISSTKREALDASKRFNTTHSYDVPVTFVNNNLQRVKFEDRTPYSLIAVARLDEVKQLDHIIRAVYTLHQKFPKLSLTFYGYGDKQETPKLKQLAKDLHTESYIHFAGFKQDLTGAYNTAWLEILTSKLEGFAMALLEAQEHGVPAISYDINYGPSEIITNNYNGRLIKKNDEQALVDNLDFLLSHPEIIEIYSQNAYKSDGRYSFNNVAKKWNEFLKKEGLD